MKYTRVAILVIVALLTIAIGLFFTKDVASHSEKGIDTAGQPYLKQVTIVPKKPSNIFASKVAISPTRTQTTNQGYKMDSRAIYELLRGYEWDIDIAYRIMMCESGGNPKALNTKPPDYSVGLFQINLYGNLKYSRPSEAWLLIPENNVEYAYKMWKSQGWRPWACYYKI